MSQCNLRKLIPAYTSTPMSKFEWRPHAEVESLAPVDNLKLMRRVSGAGTEDLGETGPSQVGYFTAVVVRGVDGHRGRGALAGDGRRWAARRLAAYEQGPVVEQHATVDPRVLDDSVGLFTLINRAPPHWCSPPTCPHPKPNRALRVVGGSGETVVRQ